MVVGGCALCMIICVRNDEERMMMVVDSSSRAKGLHWSCDAAVVACAGSVRVCAVSCW
jgi:hypothetical protein